MVALALFTGASPFLSNHKFFYTSEYLSPCAIKLRICVIISTCSDSSIKISFIWFIDFMNGAQFLNLTEIPAPSPVTDISPIMRSILIVAMG